MLLVLLITCGAAAYYIATADRIYRASGLVELSVRRPRILTQQAAVIEDQASMLQSDEVFNTRLEKFKGRTVMLAALERFQLSCPRAFTNDSNDQSHSVPDAAMDLEKRLSWYGASLKLTLLRRSRLIRVEFKHTTPAVAAAACNAFCEAAEASAYDENRVSSDAAVVWLEAQAELQRKELLGADDALLRFRQEHKLDVLESQRRTVEDSLLEFNKALVDIEGREAMEQDMLATLEELDLNPEKAGQLPSTVPRAEEIRGAMEKWRVSLAERDCLLIKYTAKHPEVQARDRVVDLYRGQAMEALKRAKATTMSNRGLLSRQAASLGEKKSLESKVAAALESQIVEAKIRLGALERARDAADHSYRGILGRIQDARMAADENTATVKVVERASIPRNPVRPQPVRVVMLAILVGMVSGLGLAFSKDRLEDHVAGPEDVDNVGIPILAVVPHVRTSDRMAVATASLNQRFSEITEAFAGLRAMLDSPQYKEHAKVVLVASSAPGEGKTVACCNLAVAWAKKGRRVLLVDFDLRRPRLAGIFPMPSGRKGLLDVLQGAPFATEFPDVEYTLENCPGLHVIASRPVCSASPAEVVGTAAAGNLIYWARQRFDHVILDVPPIGLVCDALALAPLADCTLVMVRPEVSRKRLTWHTIQRLRNAGIQTLALVVNDVEFSKSHYGAYSPYYHYQKHYKVYASSSSCPETPV